MKTIAIRCDRCGKEIDTEKERYIRININKQWTDYGRERSIITNESEYCEKCAYEVISVINFLNVPQKDPLS